MRKCMCEEGMVVMVAVIAEWKEVLEGMGVGARAEAEEEEEDKDDEEDEMKDEVLVLVGSI